MVGLETEGVLVPLLVLLLFWVKLGYDPKEEPVMVQVLLLGRDEELALVLELDDKSALEIPYCIHVVTLSPKDSTQQATPHNFACPS